MGKFDNDRTGGDKPIGSALSRLAQRRRDQLESETEPKQGTLADEIKRNATIGAGGGVHGSGSERTKIEREFDEFHKANPHVYRKLEDMTMKAFARGRKKVGIGMLFEVLRWEHIMSTDDPASDFKLNNNYRAHYARKIMENNTHLAGIFNTRELREARSRKQPTGRTI